MPNAMSASLASARMNSREPAFAWIAASFRSSDLSTAAPVRLARDGAPRAAAVTVAVAGAPRAHRHLHRPVSRRGCGRLGLGPPLGGLRVLLEDLVDRLAKHLR